MAVFCFNDLRAQAALSGAEGVGGGTAPVCRALRARIGFIRISIRISRTYP